MTVEQEIASVRMERPHVVILGAGASIAATIESGGDKYGRELPSMMNFVEKLELEELLNDTGLPFKGENFEDIYDAIYRQPNLNSIRRALEERIYNYSAELELPKTPNIYDLLILSLRSKDVIATFNWDPFLIQALRRNSSLGFKPPRLLFLHGNVLVGHCPCEGYFGLHGTRCALCGRKLVASKLLYPVGDKDYVNDFFIKTQWDLLSQALGDAFMVTIFGYSAPTSDAGAVKIMKEAWNGLHARNMEQFEIIDVASPAHLRKTWSPFIHTHHYEIHSTLNDSWIGKHSRRTGEAYIHQYLEAQFVEDNKFPTFSNLDEMQQWFSVFQKPETDVHIA